MSSNVASSPVESASRATAGAGAQLPFLDQIQASFGHHDISGIRAHSGEAVRHGAADLGARAFAVGDAVAFAETPDLHTAAHEAAHVVQQRAGKSPAGRIDSPGDALEQHADAVADAVVAGRSAVALLDQVTGTSGPTLAVQRKAAPQTTPEFVKINRVKVLTAIADYIKDEGAFQLPIPHGRLRWSDRENARFELGKAIFEAGNAAPDEALKTLSHLAYPANLFALVSEARQGPQGSALGVALTRVAAAFDGPLTQSILRMGARLVVRLDAKQGSRKEIDTVIASSPLDSLVARVMMKGPVTVYVQPIKGAKDDTGGKPFEHGADGILEYEWLGKRDRSLWNWIKVKKPTTATAEQVAMLNLVGNGNDNAEQAYRIAANPPYFGIPFETARRVKEAWEYAPADVERTLTRTDHHGPRVASSSAFETSTVSDEAALAGAPKHSQSKLTPEQTINRMEAQLAFMRNALLPWKLAGELSGATAFVERRRKEATTRSKDLQRFVPAMIAQERILKDASSELGEILDDIAAKQVDAKHVRALGPVVRICRAFAHAAGTSHLHGAADAALSEARHLHRMLPLALAEDRIAAARASLGDERRTDGADPRSDQNVGSLVALERKSAELRTKATRGQQLDPDDVDDLTIDASMLELRARLVTLAKQVRTLRSRANEVGADGGRHPSGGGSVEILCNLILARVDSTRDTSWQKRLDAADRTPHGQGKDPRTGEVLSAKRTRNQRRLQELTFVDTSLANFSKEHLGKVLDPKTGEVQDDFFTWAYKIVADEELRKLILSIALQVGVSLLTGQVVGAVGTAIRGVAAAGEIASVFRSTSLLYRGASFAAQVATQTSTQAILGQPVDTSTVLENAVGLVLTSAAMRPFRALLDDAAGVEKQVIHGWRQFAAASGKYVAEMVIDAGVGITAAALARRVVRGGHMDIAHADEWISQGLAFAANRYVHDRTLRMHKRLQNEAAEYADLGKLAKLRADVESLSKQTAKPKPTPEDALAELTRLHQLANRELALLPSDSPTKKKLAREHASNAVKSAEATLQLSGLSPVTQGHIYEGTPADIKKAVAAARAAGVELESRGNNIYTVGDRRFTLLPINGGPSKPLVAGNTSPRSRLPITADELGTLSQRGFKGNTKDFEAWAAKVEKLAPDIQRTLLSAMRTHVGVLGPNAALDLLRQNIPLDAVHLDGIRALTRASSRSVTDALISKAPAGLDDLLRYAASHPGDARTLAKLKPDVVAQLKGADAPLMADVMRLATSDAAKLAALFRTYGKGASDYLRYHPSRTLIDFSEGLAHQAKQIRTHVDTLYTGIPAAKVAHDSSHTTVPANGWRLITERSKDTGGRDKWRSEIEDPSGKHIEIGRIWDPASGTLTMDTAFGAQGMEMVPTSPALIQRSGKTPAMTFVNLHQMRAIGIPHGKGLSSSPLKRIKMSTIQNFETIGHLHWLRQRYPQAKLETLIAHTASYRYAEDIATQAGYRVKSARFDKGQGNIPPGRLLRFFEAEARAKSLFQQSGKARAVEHNKMFSRYDIDADRLRTGNASADMLTNFDIYLELEPMR